MVLVTGGTGFLGSHLLIHLLENEENVRAIYRNKSKIAKVKLLFSAAEKSDLFEKIEWIKADILDVSALEIAFKGIDYVYHCAGLISYDPDDETALRKTNIEGTANIVNLCLDHNIKKLCHVSSIAALGDRKPNENEITEENEWNPETAHSDYAISKYGAEMEIWRGQQEGLNVVIVNAGVIFGAGFWNQGSGLFFSAVKKGFPFYTNGSTGYIGVFDVVKIMIGLMESSIAGERFITVAENITFKKIIFDIAENLNVKKPTIEATPCYLNAAWRLDWLVSKIFRTKRKLSKYSVAALLQDDKILNTKIKNALNFEFQSMDNVIKEVVVLYDD